MNRFAFFSLLAALATYIPTAFADSDVVDEWCNYLGKRLRSVSAKTCLAENFVAAPERTKLGNPLVLTDIASDNLPVDAKRILVIGGIHGDELTSVSIVFRWIDLVKQPTALPYRWRVIPLANPDGLKSKPSTRVNANGVDLNRNFHTPDWEKSAEDYWVNKTHKDPRRYPGVAAASEVETRWLQGQIEEFKPDLIISVHAPYNLLDYDGPVPEPLRFGRLTLTRLGVYPGSLGNYAGVNKQIPVITIELPNATSMASQRDQSAMWGDMLKWVDNNIRPLESAIAKAGKQPASTAKAAEPATGKIAESAIGASTVTDAAAGKAKVAASAGDKAVDVAKTAAPAAGAPTAATSAAAAPSVAASVVAAPVAAAPVVAAPTVAEPTAATPAPTTPAAATLAVATPTATAPTAAASATVSVPPVADGGKDKPPAVLDGKAAEPVVAESAVTEATPGHDKATEAKAGDGKAEESKTKAGKASEQTAKKGRLAEPKASATPVVQPAPERDKAAAEPAAVPAARPAGAATERKAGGANVSVLMPRH